MENLPHYIEIAMQLGITPLNIVLAAMLYFIGAQHNIFPRWWEGEGDAPATRAQMDKLSSYYNHDTTAILQSIDEGVKNVHRAVESLEDSVKELQLNHSEWEKFGIPVRDKK